MAIEGRLRNMAAFTIGPLVPADETFNHQIADTFATVSQSDRSWTEKVCAMTCARDGSLQLGFGIGKYPNRDVLDGYAGVSRGVEQWTVRASRELAPDFSTGVGPIHYDVIEPLRSVRFRLEPNGSQPIAFDWTFEAAVPPFLEDRDQHRSRPDSARLEADIVRYHQTGVAHGWAEVDGERLDLDRAAWVSTRDHSWGVRYQVGAPPEDVRAPASLAGVASLIMWCPVLMERPDGSRYALHWFFQRHALTGWQRVEFQGGVEYGDGHKDHFAACVPELRVRDDNRRVLGGTLHVTMADGSARPIAIEAVSDTGFHLGAGLYHGFDGHWHGQWRGELHQEGEHFADCSAVDVAHRLHQHRDAVVRVIDPVGDGVGIGNLQSIITGSHPEMGLTEEASFL
jgi:hypothetical protein